MFLKLKVSIGANIVEGPWGGGNLFFKNLSNYLISQGHKVVYNLDDPDIDIILLTDPRKSSESSAYTHIEIYEYVKSINSEALVIHRINECDERKNTIGLNKFLINANMVADSTVFVSDWLMKLFHKQGIKVKENHVILSGSDKKIFNREGFKPLIQNQKIKIVTHHWGTNKNKGFDIYYLLDELAGKAEYKNIFQFTYIGKLPKKHKFKNSEIISPLSGKDLARELKSNNLYITASINEPSGNHHIEAAQCGLPILYIDSGGITEYCKDFGVAYTKENLIEKINYVKNNYEDYYEKMIYYSNSSDSMVREYENLMLRLIKNKETVLKNRNLDKIKKLYINNLLRKIIRT